MALDPTTLRILLVDDDAGVRAAGRRLMTSELASVFIGEATTAEEALVAIARESWDVVVLDVRLPGRSGLDVLPAIRGLRPDMPVVVWSALHQEPYAAAALACGAAAYVDKEFAADELVPVIERVVRSGRSAG
ncbi:MAG: transcriptional regulator, LuxR family [Myxococcales bacterium]|nr:transcriptional regulator, LuxR family [Myxococcales bacterium]